MKLKRYNEYIKESLGEDLKDEIDEYQDIKVDLLDMIEDTINSNDTKLAKEFIDTYIEDTDDTNIEGLINDSDIYEFYLKYINEIDAILNDINFFEKPPSEEGALGLYDYLVDGTIVAIVEIFKQLQEDLGEPTNES